MNNFFKAIIISLLVVVSAFMTVSCKKKEAQQNNSLYVGTNAEFAPFEYLDNGKIVGFDIDLINEIGKLIGKEIIIKNIAFDGLLPAMQAKKLDLIIAGMTANDERRKSVNFSTPYFTSKQAIIINNDNDKITSFESLPNNNVGVVLGYTGDVIVTDIKDVNIQRYNASSEAIMALNSKKVDAVVIDFEPAKNYVKYNENLKLIETDLAQEEYSIAIPKDNIALLEEVNKALETLKANGTYEALLKKYFQ